MFLVSRGSLLHGVHGALSSSFPPIAVVGCSAALHHLLPHAPSFRVVLGLCARGFPASTLGALAKDLKDRMRQVGDVTYADAHRHRRNEGVVEFASYSDMKRAIEKLDNTEINGRRIRVVEEKPIRSFSRSRSRSRKRSKSRSPRRNRRSRSGSRRRKSRSPQKRRRSRSASRSRSRSVKRRSRSASRRRRSSESRSKSPAPRRKSRSRSRSPKHRSRSASKDRKQASRSRSRSVASKRSEDEKAASRSRSRSPSKKRSKPSSRSRSRSASNDRKSRSRSRSEGKADKKSLSRSRSKSPASSGGGRKSRSASRSKSPCWWQGGFSEPLQVACQGARAARGVARSRRKSHRRSQVEVAAVAAGSPALLHLAGERRMGRSPGRTGERARLVADLVIGHVRTLPVPKAARVNRSPPGASHGRGAAADPRLAAAKMATTKLQHHATPFAAVFFFFSLP
ncbi:hypothetical protein MTO96_026525 [Rhipicephalus appendiculatus]